ncbi:MAG TPA: MFS transporter [Caulobacterales bacterium]|nr:MFS transporter [Caulobacterales bacterium]
MTIPDPAPPKHWFTPGVAGIGGASFLSDVGHEVPTSLLPSLITSFGAPAAVLGLIEGLANGVAGLAKLVGGPLADDPERRKSIAVGGYAATAVLSSLIGAATAVWQIGILRMGAWTARGLRVPARNALLADIVPAAVYGKAYGFERAMDNLGAIVGPLLALALVGGVGVHNAILLSVVPGLMAAGAVIFVIRRAPRISARPRTKLSLAIGPLLRGDLGKLFVGVSAFELGNVAATLLILRTTEALTPAHGLQSATQISLALYVAYNLAATLISVPAGHVGDRWGAVRVLVGGAAFTLAAYVAFAIAGLPALAAGFVLAGLGIGCMETAQHAAVATLAPVDVRGSAFGVLAAVQSFGSVCASAIAGLIWTLVSPSTAFAYLAVWMAIAVFAILLATKKRMP